MTENAQFTRSCKEDEVKETDAYELKATDKKGRILVARKAFQPGDVILTDSPVVSASWHLYKCFSCNTPHPTSSCEKVRINFPAMPLLLMSAKPIPTPENGVKLTKNQKKNRNRKAAKKGSPLDIDGISVALAAFDRIEEVDRARLD